MRRHPSGGAIVVAALAVLLGGVCPPSGAAVGPRLEARPEKMDYGSIRQGEEVRKVFLLRNTGDKTLVIEQKSGLPARSAWWTRPRRTASSRARRSSCP